MVKSDQPIHLNRNAKLLCEDADKTENVVDMEAEVFLLEVLEPVAGVAVAVAMVESLLQVGLLLIFVIVLLLV